MSGTELRARVEAALARPPLCDADAAQREELEAALGDADELEDLPGKWQAAILEAERAAG